MFLTTEPRGYLLAVWVALEDIEAGSGELTFYPGSHRLPYLFNKDIAHGHTPWKLDPKHHVAYDTKVQELIRKHGLEPVYYRPKKGDVLIWHANLLHGGSPVVYPELTRKSMVSHYFAEDVLCYQESMERPVVIL
jgi:ectoine hydroxylase-related dioxygenase (phytanoyl-CoA dioxygenase family)